MSDDCRQKRFAQIEKTKIIKNSTKTTEKKRKTREMSEEKGRVVHPMITSQL